MDVVDWKRPTIGRRRSSFRSPLLKGAWWDGAAWVSEQWLALWP